MGYAWRGIINRVAPWQTENWLKEMQRSLRPNQFQRMIRNEFVQGQGFLIDPDIDLTNVLIRCWVIALPIQTLICWAGIDARFKHDFTALALRLLGIK